MVEGITLALQGLPDPAGRRLPDRQLDAGRHRACRDLLWSGHPRSRPGSTPPPCSSVRWCRCPSAVPGPRPAPSGLALVGIAQIMDLSTAATAGAVISGAYFGDKMSPLSDTTNLSPAMVGADLFVHIRHMAWTTGPSVIIALILFTVMGLNAKAGQAPAQRSQCRPRPARTELHDRHPGPAAVGAAADPGHAQGAGLPGHFDRRAGGLRGGADLATRPGATLWRSRGNHVRLGRLGQGPADGPGRRFQHRNRRRVAGRVAVARRHVEHAEHHVADHVGHVFRRRDGAHRACCSASSMR